MRKFRNQRDVDRLTGEAGKQLDFHHATERGFGIRVSYGGRKTYYARYRIEGRQRRATIGHDPSTPWTRRGASVAPSSRTSIRE